MQEKLINWIKQPQVVKSVYLAGCMIGSFSMGILTHTSIVNQNNTPIISVPKQPLPAAYRYKDPEIQNPYDQLPAVTPSVPGEELGQTNSIKSNTSPVSSATTTQNFVASKTGTKYYPAGCSGINRIKEENRVYFNTEQEAINKGYERTSTCQ
jgi:hypothetical protein